MTGEIAHQQVKRTREALCLAEQRANGAGVAETQQVPHDLANLTNLGNTMAPRACAVYLTSDWGGNCARS